MEQDITPISLAALKKDLKAYFNRIADGERFYVAYNPPEGSKQTFLLQSKEQYDATLQQPDHTMSQKAGVPAAYNPNLAVRLDSLPIKASVMNRLNKAGMVYVGDVVRLSERELALRDLLGRAPERKELQDKIFDRFGFKYETPIPAAYDSSRPDTGTEPAQAFHTMGQVRKSAVLGRDLLGNDRVVVKDTEGETLAVFTPVEF